jgi:hypothetical protein
MTSLARPHSPSYHSTSHLTSLSRLALLSWFDTTRDARAMPWRRRFDPTLTREELGQRAYEIMISEVMLQQTQIATVIPFWERWMEKVSAICLEEPGGGRNRTRLVRWKADLVLLLLAARVGTVSNDQRSF